MRWGGGGGGEKKEKGGRCHLGDEAETFGRHGVSFISFLCERRRDEVCLIVKLAVRSDLVSDNIGSVRDALTHRAACIRCVLVCFRQILKTIRNMKWVNIYSLERLLHVEAILQFNQCFNFYRNRPFTPVDTLLTFDFTCCHSKGQPIQKNPQTNQKTLKLLKTVLTYRLTPLLTPLH